MEGAGVVWVRTRGVVSALVRAATGDAFDQVGVYWSNEQGQHPYRLLDGRTCCAVIPPVPRGSPWIESTPTLETLLLTDDRLIRVHVMPFFRPDLGHVARFVQTFALSERPTPRATLEAFLHAPFSLTSLLPDLGPLTFIPHCAYPGINVLSRPDPTEEISTQDDMAALKEMGMALVAGRLRLDSALPEMNQSCMWCSEYRQAVQRLMTQGHLDTSSVFLRHATDPQWLGAVLKSIPPDLARAWKSLSGELVACLQKGDVPQVPIALLEDTLAFFDASPSHALPKAPFSLLAVPGNEEQEGPAVFQTLRHIPLFNADLAGLDRDQLEELEQHLHHPSAVENPATFTLRKRVHDALYGSPKIDTAGTVSEDT